MAEFLTTTGTAHHLEQIVSHAQEHLILISPFLQISTILLERLQDAERRGVRITIVYGKDDLRRDQRQQLVRLRSLHLYFLENLHAKCYMNETSAIITSMNMYEYSEKRNREMGILLASAEPAYVAAQTEVESIIAAAACERAPESAQEPGRSLHGIASHPVTAVRGSTRERGAQQGVRSYQPAAERKDQQTGVCIRCLTEIPRNAARPLCRACFEIWASFGNPEYPERGCHHCGKPGDLSLAKPLCRSCYRAAQPVR